VELPFYNVNPYGSRKCRLIFYYIINKTNSIPRDVQVLYLQLYKLELGGNGGGGGGGGGGDDDDNGNDDDDSFSYDHPSSFMNKCRKITKDKRQTYLRSLNVRESQGNCEGSDSQQGQSSCRNTGFKKNKGLY